MKAMHHLCNVFFVPDPAASIEERGFHRIGHTYEFLGKALRYNTLFCTHLRLITLLLKRIKSLLERDSHSDVNMRKKDSTAGLSKKNCGTD